MLSILIWLALLVRMFGLLEVELAGFVPMLVDSEPFLRRLGLPKVELAGFLSILIWLAALLPRRLGLLEVAQGWFLVSSIELRLTR